MSTLRWMQSTQPICRIQNDISNFKIANNNLAAILISTLSESTINLHNQIHNSTAAALSTLRPSDMGMPSSAGGAPNARPKTDPGMYGRLQERI